MEFLSILSTCDEILSIHVLNKISVELFMHNEGIDDATDPDNLVATLDYKNHKCEYMYPESSVKG